ncbi:uncharacterized protein [Phaseolus vulgaris]|uniref:uncharacterized protein n=1 Tax=Phaseolus vulgaris TaxID=3885 RepID=UPI0035CA5B4E
MAENTNDNNNATQGTSNVVFTTQTIFAKPFLDVSKIEVFTGQNFRRWQERVSTLLDMYKVALALTTSKPTQPRLRNKLTIGSMQIRYVVTLYSNAKDIWDSLILKYTAEDIVRQRFIIANYYRWEMIEGKDIKIQINENHKLIEDIKTESITLPDEFVSELLIEKLLQSWTDYKQQLKHRHKQMTLSDLITHIIIEDTNRKECAAAKAKTLSAKANVVEDKLAPKRYKKKIDHKKKYNKFSRTNGTNPTFKKKGNCFVCGKLGHHAPQCRHRAKNGYPPKANLVEGENTIVVIISQVNLVTNVSKWVVDSGATRHICANKNVFTSYTSVGDGEEQVYLGDSRTTPVLGKGKILLKLTSGKTLVLSDVLHVPSIRVNLISVTLLSKVGVKVSFEYDKIVMTKNNVFVGKGYCDQCLFVLNISEIMNESESSAYIVDSGTSEQLIDSASDTLSEDVRRSKRQRKETSFRDDFYTYLVENDPISFVEATSAPDAKHWDKAIKTELDSIKKNNTWTLVDLPKGAKLIGCKWIFKKKYHPDGSIQKYKARLIAKGFTQKHNIDYFDTFAPVTRISSIRVLLALTSIHKPDIAYAVGRLSRYTQCPSQDYWDALARLMKYLRGTMDYAIEYSVFPVVLEGYNDANWISDSDETKSTSGYVFTLGGGAVTWRSARQTIIARSTMESEFVALEMASSEAEWLKKSERNLEDPLTKPLGRKNGFRNIEGNET